LARSEKCRPLAMLEELNDHPVWRTDICKASAGKRGAWRVTTAVLPLYAGAGKAIDDDAALAARLAGRESILRGVTCGRCGPSMPRRWEGTM
jgi:hypothetical protein